MRVAPTRLAANGATGADHLRADPELLVGQCHELAGAERAAVAPLHIHVGPRQDAAELTELTSGAGARGRLRGDRRIHHIHNSHQCSYRDGRGKRPVLVSCVLSRL